MVPEWGPALPSGGLSRGHYWLLNLGQAMPNWSSENQKGFSSSFFKKKIKISKIKEKTQNAFFKTPNPPYPTHDAQPMDGKGLISPTTAIDTIATHSRFLILSIPNNEMSRKSPFAIQKALQGIGGNPKSVKKLRSGDLLIETISALQTKSFLLEKTFIDSNLTVTPHKSLNSCRGVISQPDLLYASEGEILEGLLTRVLPRSEELQYLKTQHWKNEKQIQEIKTNKNIAYVEARKLIVPQTSHTYAQAAKFSNKTSSTQTDENITKIKCPPLDLLQPLSSTTRTNLSISTPDVSTSLSSTQAQLLPSTSSISTSNSESQPPIPTCNYAPSNNMVTPIESSSSIIPNSSSQSVLQPPSDSNTVQDAKKVAKARSRKRKKELLKKMKEAIIDIKMNPHRPKNRHLMSIQRMRKK
ncbi:uncharacterized protein TNCV_3155991 [Trichonephila clavipes]|nr:uncharacterized protein TNCV_3155991 [Trichonephila clavipes]